MDTEYLRRSKEWEIGPDMSELAKKANALFQFLVNQGELIEADEDTKERMEALASRKFTMEKEIEEDPNPRPELVRQIEQIDEELNELYEEFSDVYNIELDDEDYSGWDISSFNVEKLGQRYMVGDEYDMENAAEKYLEQLYDDIGYSHLPDWILEDALDKDGVVYYFKEMFSDDVYNNPEDYLQEQGKDFSQEQKKFYDSHKLESNALLKRILKLSEGLKNEPEGEREDQMRELIKKLEDKYFGLIEKMDEIEAEPEGEYKEDAIQEKIDELVESVEENLMKYIEDYGLEINNFLDGEEIIRLVIQSDGYQVMSSHDGELNEEYVDGETFYIIRID
jgi:uncharacterized coiled-coil protein SlyX